MRTPEELKQLLQQVKKNDYAVPDGTDVDSVIDDMLKYIGHTDGELRDKLIYSTIMEWGEYKGLISADKMKQMLNTCLSGTHLFYGIGENGTDSVFTRSFSALVLSVAFCMHYENPFLAAEDVRVTKEAVLKYIGLEKDYRGYVDSKGWAHAIAHIADALANIAGCEVDDEVAIGSDGTGDILAAVKALVCNKEYVYSAEEDERLVEPVMVAIYTEMLTTQGLLAWVDGFNMADKEYWKGTMPGDYYLHVNRKNFMRSLYFRLQSEISTEGFEEICKHMRGFLVNDAGDDD